MRELHHFTSLHRLESILKEGRIRTTESNVGSPSPVLPPAGEHLAADVVWLLSVPVVSHNHGLKGTNGVRLLHDKTDVRITVRVEDAIPWLRWKPAEDMNPAWRRMFVRAGGGRNAVREWWVLEREIPRDEWVEIRTPGGVLDFTTL